MSRFLIHDGQTIVNTIVAESPEIAEEVTGMTAIPVDGILQIGSTLHDGEWRPPMPGEGMWEWDANTGEWVEVTPEPDPAVE